MIDREARDKLAEALQRYLHEESSAFELDVAREAIETDDETVQAISGWLWYFYDEDTDHKVVANKEEWDLFQRLLLILRSNARIEIIEQRQWTWRQPAALALLLLVGFCLTFSGFRENIILLAIPINIAVLAFYCWDRMRVNDRRAAALGPFSSVIEMIAVRKSVPGFRKTMFPVLLQKRRVRGRLVQGFMYAHWICTSILPGLLWLLCLVFPENRSETRVVLD